MQTENTMKSSLQPAPRVGQIITVEGIRYRVWDIPSYGVIVLETMDGKSHFRLQGQAWRVS